MKRVVLLSFLIWIMSVPAVRAVVYTGAMDSRYGYPHIPGFVAQSKAFKAGGNPGEGVRLEWQVDNVVNPGSWTYTYRLIRGTSKNKGLAYFDIETAADFTAANVLSRKVLWAASPTSSTIPSGLSSVTISDPVSFNAVHDFSNAAVTEGKFSLVALSKSELSHYSGDPAIVPLGGPGRDASDTPSVGPVSHPFYGIRVTFPGTHVNLAYEAAEWEFQIVSDRAPMWGSFFGWADQTQISPFWYANLYNINIDNPVRLALPPTHNLTGAAPYRGWILVPGSQQAAQPSLLTIDLATYTRTSAGDGTLTLFATALANAVLTVSGSGIAAPADMTEDTPNPVQFGKFSAQVPFTQLPSPVLLANSLDPAGISAHPVPLVDEVVISQATYNPATKVLTVSAASGDRLAPLATLSVPDIASPNILDASGTLVKTITANPPASITVVSSRGGFATAPVRTVTVPAVAASVTAAASPAATQTVNQPVVITAAGAGGTGSYEYRFYVNDGGTFYLLQPYGTANTCTWVPGKPGAYDFFVEIRSAGSSVLREGFTNVFAYVVTSPAATGVNLNVDHASPQPIGTPITFTAAGSGGVGTYEYRYWLNSGSGYVIVRPYSTANSWLFTPASAGFYDIFIEVRIVGSSAERDAFNSVLGYRIQ